MIEARNLVNISQSEIGRVVGVRSSLVSRWEKGKAVPTLEQIILVAQHTKQDPSYFVPTLKEMKIAWL